jgi:hypothetical protein
MTYRERLLEHLAEYKRSRFPTLADGIYRRGDRVASYPHILPAEDWRLNLREARRDVICQYLADHGIKRHRDFHHLNSSQAFAFNLFIPYLGGGAESAAVLLKALGQQPRLVDWQLEAIPVANVGSNIDVRWVTGDGVTTFCEVKLSEAELGVATGEDARMERLRSKMREVYRPVLADHVAPTLLAEPTCFEAYQFLRNVWHLARVPGSRLVFLIPRENEVLWRSMQSHVVSVSESTRARLSTVAVEDVVACLCRETDGSCGLLECAVELRSKYLLD